MIIYKITNKITNKVYIGQTVVSIKKRWGDHCSKGSHCTFLTRSIQKNGKENFTIEQIDSAQSLEELNEKEVYWIKFYNSTNQEFGYNLASGGDSSPCHEETKKKISLANTGKKRTDEVKEIFRQNNLGKKLTDEHKKKISEGNKGHNRPSKYKGIPRSKEVIEQGVLTRKLNGNYKYSDETKEKMRQAKIGSKHTDEHCKKISNKLKGIVRSEATRKRMSEAQKNRKVSQETIQKTKDTVLKKKLIKLLIELLRNQHEK